LLAGSGSKLVGLFGSVFFSSTTAAVVADEPALVEAVAAVVVLVVLAVEAVLVLAEVFAGAGGRLFCGFVIVCDFIFSSILSSSSTRGSNVLCFIP